jgi:hypothetical protein
LLDEEKINKNLTFKWKIVWGNFNLKLEIALIDLNFIKDFERLSI